MIDKTTLGVSAEPDEVQAVLQSLCGYHLAEPDPLFRYNVLTREQVLYDALVASIRRERGRALMELVSRGHTLSQIAQMTNLATRQRAQRLIALAKAGEENESNHSPAVSREFEERLAAVEATLDEVVGNPAEAPGDLFAAAPWDPFDTFTGEAAEPAETPQWSNARDIADANSWDPNRLDPNRSDTHRSDWDRADHDRAGWNRSGWSRADDAEPDAGASLLSPTKPMPALAAVLHPTKPLDAPEVPEQPDRTEDETPWWRRS